MRIFNRLIASLLTGVCLAPSLTHAAAPVSRIKEFNLGSGSQPGGITVGSDGNLWFTEIAGNSIGMITPEGVVTTYPVPQSYSYPFDITAGPNGALWFTQNIAYVGQISTSGAIETFNPPDVSSMPEGITTGPDGALWYVERLYNSVVRITTSGDETKYTVPTSETFGTGLFYIATGSDDALWMTDTYGNEIWRMTTSGGVTGYPIPTSNAEPERISPGFDGASLWFAEYAANKVARISTSGAITEYPLPGANSEPYGITAGPDQAMWFTEQGSNKIGRITSSGAVEEFAVPTPYASPSDIVTGSDGALWFTEYGSGKIGRLIPPGPPVVATLPATGVAITTAVLNGLVNPNDSVTTATFEYGTDTTYGTTLPAKNIGSGLVSLKTAAKVTGLTAETTYHFRVDATNANGTTMGADQTFTTSIGEPDASIGFSVGTLVGKGIINANGSGQTVSANISARHSKTCLVLVQNESLFADSIAVKGDGTTGDFKVEYLYGTANVTSRVVAGTFILPNVPSKAGRYLRAVAIVSAAATSGENDGINVMFTSVSSPTAVDEVRYQVSVP